MSKLFTVQAWVGESLFQVVLAGVREFIRGAINYRGCVNQWDEHLLGVLFGQLG